MLTPQIYNLFLNLPNINSVNNKLNATINAQPNNLYSLKSVIELINTDNPIVVNPFSMSCLFISICKPTKNPR